MCTMTCHLVKVENNLGRSTVIDLTVPLKGATQQNVRFRQIDHRTIEWIVFKNVKYVLKKGGKKADSDDEDIHRSGKALWDPKQLAVGNWFSTTDYFTVKAINGDKITTLNNNKEIEISRDILEHDMHNASVFEKQEKLCLTKVVDVLKEANSAAFTICFNTKVDEKAVKERLSTLTQQKLKDPKALAKELLTGPEKTFVGRLTKQEAKLGRSLMIVLPENSFASVDHRTINWIILKNVKYIVN